jgi:hypothetical protein
MEDGKSRGLHGFNGLKSAQSVQSVALIVFVFLFAAHKPVTSKYDYNKDVFPVLRDHCGACHVDGGPGPMSLMTYKSAMPWATAIREELTSGRMPPWPVDPTSPAVQGGAYAINAHDIDKIIVWASGGTPEGDADTKLPPMKFSQQWKLGPPDLKLTMPAEHTLAPGVIENPYEFSLATNTTETKWLKAVDLMPGTPSIVRDAIIRIENGPVLTLWEPDGETMATPAGTAFRLAPGSKIHVQIRYKKHFDQEQNAVSDKSTIGLYFTDPPKSGRELQSFAIDAPKLAGKPGMPARIVGLRPMLDRTYESLTVEAITPTGMHTPLLELHRPQPQWPRRFWLKNPVALAAGAEISVKVTPLSDYSDEPKPTRTFPLQVVLDYTAQ